MSVGTNSLHKTNSDQKPICLHSAADFFPEGIFVRETKMLGKSAFPLCPSLRCCCEGSNWHNQPVSKCQTISWAFQSHRRQEPTSALGKRLSAVPPQTGVPKSSSEAFLIVLFYVAWFYSCNYSGGKTSSCNYGRRFRYPWHKCSWVMPKHCAQALVPF